MCVSTMYELILVIEAIASLFENSGATKELMAENGRSAPRLPLRGRASSEAFPVEASCAGYCARLYGELGSALLRDMFLQDFSVG